MIEVQLADGSTRRLWCTFGPQQIDINPFSEQGLSRTASPHSCTAGFWFSEALVLSSISGLLYTRSATLGCLQGRSS